MRRNLAAVLIACQQKILRGYFVALMPEILHRILWRLMRVPPTRMTDLALTKLPRFNNQSVLISVLLWPAFAACGSGCGFLRPGFTQGAKNAESTLSTKSK
jgi:hypothetical protein